MQEGIKTLDIYKGVLPFIIIQFLAIITVIAFPGLVMHYKGDAVVQDPSTIQITIPQPTDGGGATMPSFGLPPLGSDGQAPAGGSGQQPALGLPPLDLSQPPAMQPPAGAAPAAPAPAPAPSMDLSQPPVIR